MRAPAGLGLACVALDLPVTSDEANAGLVPIAAAQVRSLSCSRRHGRCRGAAWLPGCAALSDGDMRSRRLLTHVHGCWPPAQYVLGNSGTVLMLCICFMAVTSAASAEMMAVGSLFTYDVYKARAPAVFIPKQKILKPETLKAEGN